MGAARRVSPRKGPRQNRSRKTVEAILTATARVLVTEGYESCTTNRVAAAWLEANRAQLGVPNPSVAAYVLIGAVEGVLMRVMVERPAWVEQGHLERELVRLVLAYLSPQAPPRR